MIDLISASVSRTNLAIWANRFWYIGIDLPYKDKVLISFQLLDCVFRRCQMDGFVLFSQLMFDKMFEFMVQRNQQRRENDHAQQHQNW
jgi:hypothetical protein